MKPYLSPFAPERGSSVAVTALSAGTAALTPRRVKRAAEALEHDGYRVVLAETVQRFEGYRSAPAHVRAAEFEYVMSAPDYGWVLSAIGGSASHEILPFVDWEKVASGRRLFVGFSDLTAVQAALWSSGGLGSVMGPAFLTHYGHASGIDSFSRMALATTTAPDQTRRCRGEVPREWPTYSLSAAAKWDHDDDEDPVMAVRSPAVTLRQGSTSGWLAPFNMGTLLLLAGTPWWPDLSGAILCMEDDETESLATVARYLTQLRQLGVFDQAAGVLIGVFPEETDLTDRNEAFKESLLENVPRGRPLGIGAPFGHVLPGMSLLWGQQAVLRCTTEGQPTLVTVRSTV